MIRKINLFFKRGIDILGSGVGLICFCPIFILCFILIKKSMPGPAFFKQERVGKNKRLFLVLKFRTMKVDKAAEENFDFQKDAERITPLGRFLRRTKIDELPQLVNVLKGDMSLVGPRPTIKKQVEQYDPFELQRLNMRPGMTGLAQVNGNINLNWKERIYYDVQYINNFNILLDLKILLKTIKIVLRGEERNIAITPRKD